MSGIAGIIRFNDTPVEPGLVNKMTSSMSYRGPDGIHHLVKGSVAMGHCMLHTTPESLSESQPLTNQDQSLVLVMDGRLDNRQDLIREIRQQSIPLRSNTDAELVLCAYQLWGKDCPCHLLGAFAFAIWDARLGKLFCARDHIGVKPFYYFNGEDFFAFASDEDAFFDLHGVSNQPYPVYIAQMLVPLFANPDLNLSWFKDIVKLSAGHAMCVELSGQKSSWAYWQLEPMQESQFSSDDECEEAFRSVFSEAIRCRLRTVGNPALMLSGGIDSASIAGRARQILHEFPNLHLQTFSVVSDDALRCDETLNIQSITKGFERHTHCISIPSFKGALSDEDFLEAAWKYPHPVHNSILIPALMYLAAARSGCRVMYDGIDADIVVSSSDSYISSLLRSKGWRQAWMESKMAGINHTYLKQHSPLTILSKSVWAVYAPKHVKLLKQKIWNPGRTSSFKDSLISQDFATNIRLEQRISDHLLSAQQRIAQESEQERLIRILFQQGVPWSMEGFDQVAARYGIEPRHPWSDKRVIEFYLRLPQRQKVRNGWTKWLVRKAAAFGLDTHVCWHSGKNHLGMQLVRRLMKNNREHVLEAIKTTECVLGDYVDMEQLHTQLGLYKKGIDHMEPYQLYQLYEIVSLGRWLVQR